MKNVPNLLHEAIYDISVLSNLDMRNENSYKDITN